jgi:hypothetical protein
MEGRGGDRTLPVAHQRLEARLERLQLPHGTGAERGQPVGHADLGGRAGPSSQRTSTTPAPTPASTRA